MHDAKKTFQFVFERIFLISLFIPTRSFAGTLSTSALPSPAISVLPAKPTPSRIPQFNDALVKLVPLYFDSSQFSSPKNESSIKILLSDLEATTHKIDSKFGVPPLNPYSKLMTGDLQKEIHLAREEFDKKSYEKARHLVRNTTSYCIACHEFAANPKLSFPTKGISKVEKLPDIDRATYLAATHQFEDAIAAFEVVLVKNKGAVPKKSQNQQWILAFKRLLAILIIAENNSFATLELISRAQEDGSVPLEFKPVVREWRARIKEWSEEAGKTSHQKPAPETNTMETVETANLLIAKAEKSTKDQGKDAGLVSYLRSYRIVTNLLSVEQTRSAKESPELFALSAKIAKIIDDINFWTLAERYHKP